MKGRDYHRAIRDVVVGVRKDDLDADTLVTLRLISGTLVEAIEAAQKKKRTCAGRYWRLEPGVRAAIVEWNESTSRKRRRIDADSGCASANKPSRRHCERTYKGPPQRESGECGVLCTACGLCYARDLKNKFCVKG
jgi:hypothetical protein